QGLAVAPNRTLSVVPLCPNSGRFVFPTMTAPARRQPHNDLVLIVRDLLGPQARPGGESYPFDGQVVLDGDGHAVQRAQRAAVQHDLLGDVGRLPGTVEVE